MFMSNTTRILLFIAAIIAILASTVVFAPSVQANPPVQRQLNWDSPQTQVLWDRACSDCHSNTTRWPWYSKLPIVSKIIVDHVVEGRKELNLSVATRKSASNIANEIEKQIKKNEMPPNNYLWLHPEAKLTDVEKQALIDGMKMTLQKSP